jgi:hypothetical protein
VSERLLWQQPPATVAEAARVLTDLGWSILPVRTGEKVPAASDWPTRSFVPTDIAADGNLGVRLEPPLVDIDFDVREAAIIGAALLPPTLVSGRPGNPRSHLWYLCETPLKYASYAEAKSANAERTMLLECRAGREKYTLVPPSTHPSGEALSWTGNTISMIEADVLQSRLALIAALTLVSRHWPAGQRHQAAGAVAGWLIAFDVPGDLIKAGVRALCQAAGDTEVEDRLRHVDTTIARAEAQVAHTGGATLKDILGETVYDKADGWVKKVWSRPRSDAQADARLAVFNQRHFVVRVGSKVVVALEDTDGLELMPFEEFKRLYIHYPKIGTTNPAAKWLEAEGRRTYERIGFAPPGASPIGSSVYNLWTGFVVSPDVRPQPERYCARYLAHLQEVIADGDTMVADYVLDLLADCVQRPGRPIGKALVLRSLQGMGKSVFVESFGRLFGRHFITVSSREQVVGRFNAHLSSKIVVFADEAVWGGSKDSIGTLKRLVTERTLTIERKGVDILTEPNYVHLFLATNEDWAWPAGNAERRGIILDLKKRSTTAEFTALWKEVESPDFLPALLAVLLARAVDTDRLRKGLVTDALGEQQDYTADPVQSWWQALLEDGIWPGDGAIIPDHSTWPTFLAGASAYDTFKLGMRDAVYGSLGHRLAFQRKWLKLLPAMTQATRRVSVRVGRQGQYEQRAMRGWLLPKLDTCRKAFDTATGHTRPWTDPVPPSFLDEGEL